MSSHILQPVIKLAKLWSVRQQSPSAQPPLKSLKKGRNWGRNFGSPGDGHTILHKRSFYPG